MKNKLRHYLKIKRRDEMTQAIIRLAILLILLLNQVLLVLGLSPLSEELLYEDASSVATIGIALWTWWKNNNVTKEAQEAQKYLNELKKEGACKPRLLF